MFPDAAVNRKAVVAPGAKPHALGNLKSPSNAYASLQPVFRPAFGFPPFLPAFGGGNFWNARAEGCGANPGSQCPVPNAGDVGAVSETITQADLPVSKQAEYAKFLGPTADQALNPFPRGVEQNAGEKKVCTQVKTAKYKSLYDQAYGEPIDCRDPAVHTSFKRLAVALAAWQKSADVVSFSSKRDKALAADADGQFPLDGLTPQENLGHDLFYGRARLQLLPQRTAEQDPGRICPGRSNRGRSKAALHRPPLSPHRRAVQSRNPWGAER